MDVAGSFCINLFTSVHTSRIFGGGDDVGIIEFDELGRPVSMT